ncbi:universal stress protein [Streptomyces sp. NPDC004980]
MGRVVTGVGGTGDSRAALRRAVAEARLRDAELWVVLAWQPPPGGPGSRSSCGFPALTACRSAAAERLREVLGTASGSAQGVPLRGVAVRGTPGAALVEVADDPEDLIVLGAGPSGPLRRLVQGSVSRYCLAHAVCPVLTVPPCPLEAELQAVHRRNVWRLRLDARELTR